MNADLLFAETSVADALLANPAVEAVLNQKRTSCVGCCMARFCTLREAAAAYEFSLDAFIGELRSAMSDPRSTTGGTGA